MAGAMLVAAALSAGTAFLACMRTPRGVGLVGMIHGTRPPHGLSPDEAFDIGILLLTADRLTLGEVEAVLARKDRPR